MKKALLIAVIAGIVGTGLVVVPKSYAVEAQNTNNPFQTLVQKIAEKFGLKKEDVQTVFDQDRKDRQAEHEKEYINRLEQLAAEKKITEAQKKLILEKHKELSAKRQSQMQNMQGKTSDERKALMQQKKAERETERTELENWAKQNGIDIQYLMGGMGRHGGPGRGF